MSVAMLARKREAAPAARTNAPSKAPSSGLRIGEPNDSFEREADRVADEVMAGGRARPEWSLSTMSIGAPLQRKCACGGSGGSGGECEACKEEKTLQRKASSPVESDVVPPVVHAVLRSPGQPLDASARAFFEPRFGYDFGNVRVHADTRAAESAKSVRAHAYAVGDHVVFGAGRYYPQGLDGRRLVAHELAHVMQQGGMRLSLLQRDSDQGSSGGGTLFEQAFAAADEARWSQVAELINGFSPEHMRYFLETFKGDPEKISYIYLGAVGNKSVGPDSQVAQATRATHLDFKYKEEVRLGHWSTAAEYLNGFSRDDIFHRLAQLKTSEVTALHDGAVANPAAGADSGTAKYSAEELANRSKREAALPAAGSQSDAKSSLAQLTTEMTQKGGAPSSLGYLSFEGILTAGQTLPGSDSDKTIHTLADTHVSVSATARQLQIQFTPALVITSATWPHPDLELTEVSFDFAKGTFGYGASGPNYAWWLGHAEGKLTAGLAGLFGAMPAAMRAPGYNPFSDTNIQANLAAFVSNLSSSSSSAPKDMPAATGVKASATFTLDGEMRQPRSGRFSLVVPKGTNVTLTGSLSGGIPRRLSDIRVSSLGIQLSSPSSKTSNVEFHVVDAGFPLIFISGATFSSGGHLQFDYTLASEALEAAGRALLGAAMVQSGQGGQAGDNALDARQPKAHAIVDALIHSNLEPLLKDLILANRHALPGMDIGEALGFGPEMGDFPSKQPGAESG